MNIAQFNIFKCKIISHLASSKTLISQRLQYHPWADVRMEAPCLVGALGVCSLCFKAQMEEDAHRRTQLCCPSNCRMKSSTPLLLCPAFTHALMCCPFLCWGMEKREKWNKRRNKWAPGYVSLTSYASLGFAIFVLYKAFSL